MLLIKINKIKSTQIAKKEKKKGKGKGKRKRTSTPKIFSNKQDKPGLTLDFLVSHLLRPTVWTRANPATKKRIHVMAFNMSMIHAVG